MLKASQFSSPQNASHRLTNSGRSWPQSKNAVFPVVEQLVRECVDLNDLVSPFTGASHRDPTDCADLGLEATNELREFTRRDERAGTVRRRRDEGAGCFQD